MPVLLSNRACARIYAGMWIADCTRPDCANAEKLTLRQSIFYCSNCRQIAEMDWPDDADDLWAVLAVRPVPQTRNWFPEGHDLAVRSGTPHGQTVADLEAENREHGVI